MLTGFNAAAADFSSEVKAAADAFAQNPSDLEPFKIIEQKLQQRRKTHAENIIASVDGSSVTNLGDCLSYLSAGAAELEQALPLELAQKTVDFIAGARDRLNAVTDQMEQTRQTIIALRDGNNAIQNDYGVFAAAVQGLPAQYAGDPKACQDDLSTLSKRTLSTQRDLATQQRRIGAMLSAADGEQARVSGLRDDIGARLLQFNDAVEAAEAFKDFIDSCSTGTRQPVSISKPLVLRKPAPAA
ncbi:MAG: hypothetical protein ACAH83_05440 [Alphaproteobacteria bacterium]